MASVVEDVAVAVGSATPEQWQHELGGIRFGLGTRYRIAEFSGLGAPGWRTDDTPMPAGDGALPGVDRLEPRTLSYTINCVGERHSPADAIALMRQLAHAWRMDDAATPGTSKPLTVRLPGLELVTFGRPRRFTESLSKVAAGLVSVVCDYLAHDPLLYGPAVSVTVGLSGAVGEGGQSSFDGGLLAPLVPPLVLGASPTAPAGAGGAQARFLALVGSAASWPELTLRGPMLGPRAVVGPTVYSFPQLELAATDVLSIVTHPARRRVVLNGTQTRYSAMERVRLVALPPGSHEVRLSARTFDSRASLTATARPAYA